MNDPRISFGIIVLNGEPFTRYCIEALYPHAHEIIVAEGAAESAREFAREDGHSTDGTLELLQEIKAKHDPEDKLTIVTCPEGQTYWKGREEQSQAYAERATGDYLWQVDIDEFYRSEDIERVRRMLLENPGIDGASFRWRNFWGGKDHVVDGWFLQSGGGDVSRLFRWGEGFRYEGHWTGLTSVSPEGERMREGNWLEAGQLAERGILMFHYSLVFPKQVFRKSEIYRGGTDPTYHHDESDDWAAETWGRLANPFRVHNRYEFPAWLERSRGSHPPAAERMFEELPERYPEMNLRGTEDVEMLLADPEYRRGRALLREMGGLYARTPNKLLAHRMLRAANHWIDGGNRGLAEGLVRFLRRGIRSRLGRGEPRTAAEALVGLRRTGVAVPTEMDPSEVSLDEVAAHPFERAIRNSARTIKGGHTIAFDLDDTLLLNSRMLADSWGQDLPEGVVEVQVLPGALGLLEGLTEGGNKVVLITATSRRRAEHLLGRLPGLARWFGDRVVAAEAIVEAQRANTQLRPREGVISLCAKTPELVSAALGEEGGFDLLVDDSERVGELVEKHVRFECRHPLATSVIGMLAGLAEHLGCEVETSELGEFDECLGDFPQVRLSDPYYLPDLNCGFEIEIEVEGLRDC